MNDTHSRWSQAQILIAALFSVVLTGEMPEPEGDSIPRIEMLEEEFRDIFDARRHVRQRLAEASITWIGDKRSLYEYRCNLCRSLTRLTIMPSEIAAIARAIITARKGTRQRRLQLIEVQRMVGVDTAMIARCCDAPTEWDGAWHNCRAELFKIRAEWAGGAR